MKNETKEPFLKLLLALGVVVPLLSYTAWGWIELLMVKPATLP